MTTPVVLQRQGALRSKHNTSGSTDANDYADEISAFSAAREGLLHMHTRLLLRLGRDHPVTAAFDAVMEAIDSGGADVMTLVTLDQPPRENGIEIAMKERKAMWNAHQRFLDAANAYMATPVRDWN